MSEFVSVCCGANFIEDTDICSKCKDHSGPMCPDCGSEVSPKAIICNECYAEYIELNDNIER